MSNEFATTQVNGMSCMTARDLFEWAEEQGCADLPIKFGGPGSICNVIVEAEVVAPGYADTELVNLYYESAV